MSRCWVLTWTTYGTWLPGDARGFVSPVRGSAGKGERHNVVNTEYTSNRPALERFARGKLRGEPVLLNREQAEVVLHQCQATADFRQWKLLAISVMRNHVHAIVRVNEDPPPGALLRDLKSYSSRALNEQWSKPLSGTWWTTSGSTRMLSDEAGVITAARYVRDQEFPLVVWLAEVVVQMLGAQ